MSLSILPKLLGTVLEGSSIASIAGPGTGLLRKIRNATLDSVRSP